MQQVCLVVESLDDDDELMLSDDYDVVRIMESVAEGVEEEVEDCFVSLHPALLLHTGGEWF